MFRGESAQEYKTHQDANFDVKGKLFCFLKYLFNLKRLGGPPPSTFRAITLQRAKLSPQHFTTFFFQVSRTFWHQICDTRGTVLKLRNFLYMHVGPKMAPKCDFVYKINANWVFSHSSYKYAYFYSQWLKWICFSIIVLQKCLPQISPKKQQKQKVKKTKKYIRNS